MEFDNENSRCVSAGPEPDARVCVILRGEEAEISLNGRSVDLMAMAAAALVECIKKARSRAAGRRCWSSLPTICGASWTTGNPYRHRRCSYEADRQGTQHLRGAAVPLGGQGQRADGQRPLQQQPVLQSDGRADSPAHAGPYGGNRPFRRTRARRVLQLWQDHAGRHGVRRTGAEGGNGK